MPTNWDSIPALKIITAENIIDAVNAEKLVPSSGYASIGTPKKAMTKERMVGTVYFDTTSTAPYYYAKTGKQLLARRDIVSFRPNIGLEARTISTSDYGALNNYDKANFSSSGYKVSQNSSGSLGTQASNYIIANQFYYAFHFTNTGTIVTQGNVVFTLTIPNGLSCVLSGGQPIVLHLRDGSVITPSTAATLSGNTLTITITAPINPYNISTNPAAYHISVLMTSALYSGWNGAISPPAIVYLPTVSTTPYAINKPLSSDFYISLNYAALAITKTNPYSSTITYNQVFDYTIIVYNYSSVVATGVVVTDVIPTGVTIVSVTPPSGSGWTASILGQTVTVNSNSNNIPANQTSSYYTIKITVRATTENINISNTASVSGTNSFTATATKTNYVDYNRTAILTSQGYYTCSGTTYLVYRDTNTNSTTYNSYYVNNVNVGSTAPTNGACSFNGSYTASYYASGTKNDCSNTCSPTTTVVGSTVILNNGAGFPTYSTSGSYTSSISQADADAQAKTIADNAFYAGLQAKYNSVGYCTWTASNISNSYSQNFTRNNCGTNCYGNGTVAYGNTQTATATSTTSCNDAISAASTAAYNAAYAVVQANGQNYANANGTCCCWVSDPTCSGCDYLGNRERNSCDGSYRNTTPTQSSSCGCNQNCQGTYYTDYYCDNRDKVYVQKYNCNGSATGATNRVNCGCDSGAQELTYQGYDTCVGCTTSAVYKDTNRCSGTYNQYFVNGGSVGGSAPSNGSCNTTPNYNLDRGVRCYAGTNYQVYQNTNGCGGGDQYQYRNGGGGVEFTSNDFGSDPCTFYAYRSGSFTRNNCGSGYNGGTVTYSHTYSYTGILNQSGADATANSNFPTDGQNYANSAGSCTAIQVCKVYDIIAYDYGYYVDGYYTYCNGGTGYFSFYASSAGSIGQTPCVNASSVYITNYGNGAAVQESYSC
jgi:uncharacterized repeat protein (TIGR01451 family)